MSDRGTHAPPETRELVVTAEVRVPLAEVVEAYRHALTPDGGIDPSTTLNAYIEQYAEGIGRDMIALVPRAGATKKWRLTRG